MYATSGLGRAYQERKEVPVPSPFPGMDPFLEDPRTWESVHTRLIAVMGELLSAQVQPHFYVDIETAVYVVTPDDLMRRPIKPDLYLVTAGAGESSPTGSAITAPTIVAPLYPEEIRQRFLEIRDAASREVVTVIELLSPTNKTPRSAGQDAFRRKRHDVMTSPVHWLEIDLLRAGDRPAEVAARSDYYALLKRGGSSVFEVWSIDVRDRLPTVAVPLVPPHADVPLDLQQALTLMYDRNYYAQRVDYSAVPPAPRLAPADAVWVEECVRAWDRTRQG